MENQPFSSMDVSKKSGHFPASHVWWHRKLCPLICQSMFHQYSISVPILPLLLYTTILRYSRFCCIPYYHTLFHEFIMDFLIFSLISRCFPLISRIPQSPWASYLHALPQPIPALHPLANAWPMELLRCSLGCLGAMKNRMAQPTIYNL